MGTLPCHDKVERQDLIVPHWSVGTIKLTQIPAHPQILLKSRSLVPSLHEPCDPGLNR